MRPEIGPQHVTYTQCTAAAAYLTILSQLRLKSSKHIMPRGILIGSPRIQKEGVGLVIVQFVQFLLQADDCVLFM
jgi:hypothetical protein